MSNKIKTVSLKEAEKINVLYEVISSMRENVVIDCWLD